MKKNVFIVKIVNVVVAVAFLWTNCVFADEMVNYKLAAQSLIPDTLKEAHLYYSVQALHLGLRMQGIENLTKLGSEIETIKRALVNAGKISNEDIDNYKCLVFSDPKTNAKAYYYFKEGVIFRITTAESVKDKFSNVLKLGKPLAEEKINVLVKYADKDGGVKFKKEINFLDVYNNVDQETLDFVSDCLDELYPDNTSEYFDVIDENTYASIGKKRREAVHRDGDWHKAVHVVVVTNDGQELLVQIRKEAAKRMDISCGGHVGLGEDPQDAAVREIGEELGIKISKNQLVQIGDRYKKIGRNDYRGFAEAYVDSVYYSYSKERFNREVSTLYFYRLSKEEEREIRKGVGTEEVAGVNFVSVSNIRDEIINDPTKYASTIKQYIIRGDVQDIIGRLCGVVGTKDFFVVDGETGKIITRLSTSGKRILRTADLSVRDIVKGIKKGRFLVKTWEEILKGLDRSKCGIGITGGGDCAGIADFLGSLKKNLNSSLTMLGVKHAGKGLMTLPEKFGDQLILVDSLAAEDFEKQASTPYGSAREDPLKKGRENTLANIKDFGFFYGTGGNDHLGLLERIAKEFPSKVVVGTFKSIDGDGWICGRPAQMLGFNTAVTVYRNAIWSAAQNARTHGEMHVIEVFGRNCGKLAFESARTYPYDFDKLSREEQRKIIECRDRTMILVPEKPVSLRVVAEGAKRIKDKEGSCVIVVAEGFLFPELKREMDRLAKDKKLKTKWLSGELTVEEIPGLIEYEDSNDPRKDLFTILKDKELAAQFGKTVWETELDVHGNVVKLAGIRKFVMQALNKIGGIKKVNELIENYEARGASPTEYDTVMGQKIGKKMAELVNQGVTGGKAVVYFEGMDAMTEDPVVVDLAGVSDKNNLNNSGLYPEEVLQENGVFWVIPEVKSYKSVCGIGYSPSDVKSVSEKIKVVLSSNIPGELSETADKYGKDKIKVVKEDSPYIVFDSPSKFLVSLRINSYIYITEGLLNLLRDDKDLFNALLNYGEKKFGIEDDKTLEAVHKLQGEYLAEEVYLKQYQNENRLEEGIIKFFKALASEKFGIDEEAKQKVLAELEENIREGKPNGESVELGDLFKRHSDENISTRKSVDISDEATIKNIEPGRYGDMVVMPEDAEVYIIGDIHGDSDTLKKIIEGINAGENVYIVFLGDYVNNGLDSVGTLLYLLDLWNKLPDGKKEHLVLLNGNHEFRETYITVIKEFFDTHWKNATDNEFLDKNPKEQNHYGHIRLELIKKYGIEEGERLYKLFEEWGRSLPYICISKNGFMMSHSIGLLKGDTPTLKFLAKGKEGDEDSIKELGFEAWKKAACTRHAVMVSNRKIDGGLLERFKKLDVNTFFVGHTHYRSGDVDYDGILYTICSSHENSKTAGHYMYQEMNVERKKTGKKEGRIGEAMPIYVKYNQADHSFEIVRTDRIDLLNFSGMPINLNPLTSQITLGDGVESEPKWDRPLRKAGNSIANPLVIDEDPGRVVYYGYRNARIAKDTATIDELKLRFDITVLLPGVIGEEFIMTKGHIHPGTNYPEYYEVWNGTALFVQQGINPETEKFELIATLAKLGDKVFLIPGYSHRTVNISFEPLVIANWICEEVGGKIGRDQYHLVDPVFSVIEAKNGYTYHVIKGPDGGIILRHNSKYGDTPSDIRFALPVKEISEFGLSSREPMYRQYSNRALAEFLRDSRGSEGLYAKSFDFTDIKHVSQVLGKPVSVEVYLTAEELSKLAEEGINKYLNNRYNSGQMPKNAYDEAKKNVLPNIEKWLDRDYMNNANPLIQQILDQTRIGVEKAIRKERWQDLVNAFFKDIVFGTAGIRGMAFLNEEDGEALFNEGLSAPILKGTNTINDVIFMRYSTGVARYMNENGKKRIVIAYDSRIQGKAFAERVAGVFLACGITVYFFDQVSPMPELSFAVTKLDEEFGCKEDTMGILVSASHNPKEYNGYKITDSLGAQLAPEERRKIFNSISKVEMKDISYKKLGDAGQDELVWLGGSERLPNVKYGEYSFIDIHSRHIAKVKEHLLLDKSILDKYAPCVNIGFAAFYGSGAVSTPRMLREIGFRNLKIVSKLSELDGRFPGFIMPDPGNVKSWKVAIQEFISEYGEDELDKTDIIVGTDPDADRMGVVIKTPDGLGNLGEKKNLKLLTANEAWSLLLYFELNILKERGQISKDSFILKSHVTTDALRNIAEKFGVACEETFVGFSILAEKIIQERKKGRVNLGAFEESNGYSVGGAQPKPGKVLGYRGHTLEKDGTMAAVKIAQIAAYAKSKDSTLYDLINGMRLDSQIGYFGTDNQPIEFKGIEGLAQRTEVIRWVQEDLIRQVDGEIVYKTWDSQNKKIVEKEKRKNNVQNPLTIAGRKVIAVTIFQSGKYDNDTFAGFADEGIRFYFDSTGDNHITIRASGTEPKIRIYVQWTAPDLKRDTMDIAVRGVDELIAQLGKEIKNLITNEASAVMRGSHIVREIEKDAEEKVLYKARINNKGELVSGEILSRETEKIIGHEDALRKELIRLLGLYDGLGILARIEEVQIVENLNGKGLYPSGRAPLASFSDGVLKIDSLVFEYGPDILLEELEHEALEGIADIIPGVPHTLADLVSTVRNVERFLKLETGQQDLFVQALKGKIDPDGEYKKLLERLRRIKDVSENEIIASVVRYAFRTKLYEKVRDELGLPKGLAKEIRELEPRLDDAMEVYNVIAKAKQGEKLVSEVRDGEELAIKVVKTFTETARIRGLEKLKKKLAGIIAASVKAAGRMHEIAELPLAMTQGGHCIVLDKNRIPEGMQDKWDNEIKRLKKNNIYNVVYSLDEALKDYRPENIIYLLDPADIKEKDKMKEGILYLPMPYLRSSLYMAAVVVSSGGDISKVDVLIKGLISDLYSQILGREIKEQDLLNLFTAPWLLLPEIISVLGDINNLRKTLTEIEKAA